MNKKLVITWVNTIVYILLSIPWLITFHIDSLMIFILIITIISYIWFDYFNHKLIESQQDYIDDLINESIRREK